MTDGADNNGELPTLEQIQQTVTELAAMGLIYDTGRTGRSHRMGSSS